MGKFTTSVKKIIQEVESGEWSFLYTFATFVGVMQDRRDESEGVK